MLIIAVVVGYILGVAPFLWLEYKDKEIFKKTVKTENEENKEYNMANFLDEYLNGAKTEKEVVNTVQKTGNEIQNEIQHDIYNEFVTGEESILKAKVGD